METRPLDGPTPGMRILLVEDERSAARMIAKGLREYGYAVDIAEDGEAGLQQAGAVQYDLIVLDLMLPRKNGLDVCSELRAGGSACSPDAHPPVTPSKRGLQDSTAVPTTTSPNRSRSVAVGTRTRPQPSSRAASLARLSGHRPV